MLASLEALGRMGRGQNQLVAGVPSPILPYRSGWFGTPRALLYSRARQLGQVAEPLGVVPTACPPETLVEHGVRGVGAGNHGSHLTHPTASGLARLIKHSPLVCPQA